MTRKYSTVSYLLPTSGLVRYGLTTVLQTICALVYLFLLIPQTATAQCDSQNGTITVTASGGAMNGANLVYVLTNPAGTILNYSQTPTFTNVADGSYQVYAVGYRGSALPFSIGQGISSITANNACVQYSSAPVNYSVCSTSATCDSQNGTITATASGGMMGTAKLAYLLTDATGTILQTSSSPTFSGVAVGTYYVYALGYTNTSPPFTVGQNISVIPTNDACAKLSQPLGYKVCPVPCPTITNVAPNNTNPSSCSGANGSILICGVTPATSYTISYSKNGVAQPSFTQTANASGCLSLSGLTAGTYSAIKVVDATCTTGSNTLGPITLSDPGAPTAPTLALNPTSGTICAGQSVTLTASGAAGATFTFSGPGLGVPSGNSVVATPNNIGTAIYTLTQSASGCTSSAASQTVVVNTQPAISGVTTANPNACGTSTGSLTLNGLAPSTTYTVSYSKNGGAATTATLTSNASGQVTLSGLSAGSYAAITASNGGCTSSAQTASLSDPSAPTAPVLTANPATSIICLGQSVTLNASGTSGATFAFAGPGLSSTSGPSVTATPTSAGSAVYTVTQTASGCTSLAATYTVTVNAQPAISSVTPSNPSSCSGTNGSIALNGLTPSTSYTVSYNYNGGAAVTQTVVANTSGVVSLTGLRAGAYTNITVGANGCNSSAQMATLSDPGSPATPTLTLNPASGTLCLGQSLTLTASGATGATFIFSGPGLGAASGNSVVATPGSVGAAVYTVSQSLSGCTSSAASQTVVVNAQPVITSVTPTNPTSCGTATGNILLSGLTPSSTYSVSYSKNGASPTTATLTSNGSGQITISGLGAGSYTNIMVAQGGCMSAPSSSTVTLTDPTPAPLTAAQVTGISPTSCSSATGRIDITGLPASTSVVIGYSKNGTPTSATVSTNASGQASILNLTAGTYTAFTLQIGACTSAPYAGPVQLSDPGFPPLTAANIANTNPTSCGNNDAQITLSGLPASTAVTITYQVSGTAASANVTTNASGQAVIPNLKAGNYSVIAYTIGACTSAPYNGTVVINDPAVTPLTSSNFTAFNPTSCSATDGRIEITGLASNISTVITYKKNGIAANTTVTSDNGGKVTIPNIGVGTYTDFNYTQGACTSTPYTGSLVVNGVNCNQNPPLVTGKPLVTNVNTPGSVCLPVSDADGTTSYTVAICSQPANGTASVPATVNGTEVCVNYTPPANFTGNAGTVCVIVTDPTGLTSVAYVPVVVNPVSGTAPTGQPPVVTVVPITTPVNTTATVCLPVSDPNGTTSFTAAICGQPTNGTATIVSTGTATVCPNYTPPMNFTGNAGNVCVTVTDPTGLTTTVQVPVTVTPKPTTSGPNPPVVIGAPLVTNQNQPGSVCLPVTDPDGTTAFTVTACGQPTSGTASFPATVNGNNLCVNYTPPTNFTGNAGTLCLIVTDPTGLTSVAYVPVTVIPANVPTQRPPVITGQPLVTNVNQPGSVCLPVSDPDGTTSFTAAICSQPTNGTASVPATVTGNQLCVAYTPPANFTGNAGTVCVIVTDPTGLTSVAYVPVVVNPVSGTAPTGQPPVVTVVPITTPTNTTALVCQPVTDPNGTTSFTAAICGQPTNGTAVIASTGANTVCIKYTPPTNFTGSAGNVCVTVTDPTGLTTTVQVPVTVTPTPNPGKPNPPVIVGAPLVTNQNQPGSVCLPVTDPDGTTAFTVTACGQPTSGTASFPATINGNSLCINYTPPTNFTGNAGTLCVVVTDPTGLTSVAYVPITVIPASVPTQRPPVITGQPLVTTVNQPGSVCLPVSDPDGTNSFTAAICGQPTNGTASVPATTTGNSLCVNYTPPANFTGNAGTVCVIITDPTGLTSVAYVPVVVNPISGTTVVEQPPVVTVVPVTTPVNTTATVCLPVSDPNGTTSFTAAICGQPTNGTATIVSTGTATVCIKYTPPTNFTGNAGNICVTVTDPTGLTTTVQVPVTVTPMPNPGSPNPPVIVGAPLVTNQNQPGSVCLPVTDPDGTTAFTVSVCGQPTSGTTSFPATVNGNSLCINYTPPANFTGNAGTLCLIVTDPTGLTSVAYVPITVIPANQPIQYPPLVVGQPLVTNVNQPGSVCLPVSDANGTTSFTVAICSQPANGTASVPATVNGNQLCVNYTPPANFTGNAGTVCVIVTDPTGLTSVAYVPVVVNPVSGTAPTGQPPVVTVVPITTPVNTTALVCQPVTDPNGTTSFTAAICGQPTNGTAVIASTGTNSVCIKYTPPTNFTGSAGNVCVTVTDPTGLTTTVTIPVTVTPDPTTRGNQHPPVVVGAPLVTNQNQPGSVCLPVTDPDGTTAFTVTVCGQPTSGSASVPITVNGNSICINYTPAPGFTGNAGTLCLIVTDPTGLTSVAYVPVTVVPGNIPTQHPPLVVGQPLVTNVNQPGSVCLPVSDLDGTTSFTAAICGQPTSGTASVPAIVNGSQLCVSYTPPTGFTGSAGTVCVIVTDPTGLTSVAYVPVVVNPVSGTAPTGQPPVVTVVPITTPINTTALVCQPVTDPNGTTSFTAAICGQPTNGTAVVVSTGTNSVCIKYTPPTNFTGNAGNVCVTVTDPTGLTTTVTVPVVVTPDPTSNPGVPHPPVVIGAPLVTNQNQPGSVCLPITDPDGTTAFTVSVCGQPTSGTTVIPTTVNGNSLCINYTPTPGFSGNAGTLCLIVTDPTGLTSVAYVPITVIPANISSQRPPVIVGQPLVTNVNQPGSVCLPVSDPDGTTAFTVAICGQPTNGTATVPATVNGNQVCVNYTPPANFTGNAGTVCVIITDPTGLTSVAYVPVVVNPVSGTAPTGQPPVVTVVPITTPINTTALVCLPVTDPNGTTSFTAAICGQPANGTAVIVSTGANSVCIKYTPPTNFTGNAGNVCVTVTDPTGLTTTVTVPVTVIPNPAPEPGVQHPPVVISAPLVTNQNQPGSVCLPLSDPDGTTSYTVSVCGQPTSGTTVIPTTVNGNSLCINYTPTSGFSGNAGTLCLIVTDPTGLTSVAYVPITVIPASVPTQRPPVITGQPLVTTVNQSGSVCLPVVDPDGTTAFTVSICGQPANGVASVPTSVTGNQVCVNYTPPTNFTGNAGTICVIVTDPTGLTSVAYVPVVVTPISGTTTTTQPPVVTIVPITTPINQTVVVCQPVSSPNGATSFTATICGQPTSGTVSVVSTSANSVCLKYTPPTNFTGNAGNVCVIITDPVGQTTVVTVPVTVTPLPTTDPGVQHPPVVVVAPIVTKQGQPGSVCLPVTDPDGTTAFTVTVCGQPTSGTASVSTTVNNGVLCINYTPTNGFSGNAGNVCLIITDPTGLSTTALVPVTVIPNSVTTTRQHPPVVVGQPLVTTVNQPGSVCLPVFDVDGTNSYTVAICGQPANGVASVSASVTGNSVCVSYTPPTNFTGNAGTICVIVTDPTGLTSVAYVPVVVTPISGTTTIVGPPVVTIVPITTPINQTVVVCQPVSSPNGATSFTAAICGQPTSGTVSVVSSGTASVCLKYTPPTNFTGNAGNVCVTITEPTGQTTVVTVPITVTPDPTAPGNQHPPVVVVAPIVTKQGQPGSVCLPVTDPDGTTNFTVTVCGQPASGTAVVPTTVNNGVLCISYTPVNSFSGNAGNVCLIITDPTGLSTTALVPVTVIPNSVTTTTQHPPIITGQPLVTNQNTPGSVCLPVVDSDGTTSFTAAICGQPNSGTASVPATFTGNQVCINYTPPTSFTGYAGTVCVIITDPTGLTSTVQVPVIVSPVCTTTTSPQLPPVVVITPIVTPKDTPVTVCLPVSDPNGTTTTYTASICNQPASGTVTVVSSGTASVCIRYTPPASFTGYAGNVCVTVTDPTGLSTVVQVPIVVTPVCTCPAPPPHPPVIVGAPLVTNQNQTGRVCLPVSDPDGTTNFTVTICGLPNSGTATVPSTLVGNLLCIDYTPANGFSGNAGTLCLTVTDPTGLTATALVPITVIPTIIPHPPVIGPGSITTPINTTAQICLPLSDPDGTSSYTIAICGQPTSGTVSAPTTVVGNQVCITYTPPTNFTGNAGSFCIKVTDPTGLTTTQTVSVSVVPAPAACVTINLKVFLEGPYNSSTHLMNTTLNQRGLLPGQTPIGNFAVATPAGQPYNTAPWNYTGTEKVTSYPSDIVDWVLVTLRTDSLTTQSAFQAAGLLHNDGRITFVNPCFTIPTGNYFAVIEHRNHLGVMSPKRVSVTNNVLNFDFTQQDSYSITNPPSFGEILIDGRWMMYGADGKKDIYTDNFDINFFDSKLWKDESGIFDQYRYGDFNMDADVNFSDSVLWNKNNGRYSKVPH